MHNLNGNLAQGELNKNPSQNFHDFEYKLVIIRGDTVHGTHTPDQILTFYKRVDEVDTSSWNKL